jgi:hypothetical protein
VSWTRAPQWDYLERVSGEQQGEPLPAEIQALVEQELTRMGIREALRLEADMLVLGRGATETRAEIRGTLTQWDSLPDDLRERRIRQIAALLAQRTAVTPAPAEQAAAAARRTAGPPWYTVFAPIAIVGLTALSLVVAYRFLAPRSGVTPLVSLTPSSSAAVPSAPDADRERLAFANSACALTRERIARGASIGPADSEGWVVELDLLRRGAPVDLSLVPALSKFVTLKPGAHSGTVTWSAATHLAAMQRFDAEVAVTASPALGEDQVSGLSLVFSGPYVLPYFTDGQRTDYLQLAEALAEELGATDGGLFARCANAENHQIGAWFLGSTPGRAVGSLVYFMASYSEVPLLKPNVLGVLAGPPQRGHAFDAISAAASNMDRGAAATLIGRELGMVSGRTDHGTRLTFPFRDANRAARASVVAARALHLANSG